MNKTATLQILEFMKQTDNRQVTDEVVSVWHDIIGWLTFDVAKEAVIACMADETIRRIEPKHVVAVSKRIMERREAEARRTRQADPQPYQSTPMPVCRAHGKGIIQCDACCRKARHLNESLGGSSSPEYVARFYQEIAIQQVLA